MISTKMYKEQVTYSRHSIPSNASYEPSPVWVEGVVESYEINNETMIISSHHGFSNKSVKYKVSFHNNHEVKRLLNEGIYHFKIQLDGYEQPFKSSKNTTGFDYDLYLFSNGILGQYKILDIDTESSDNWCLHCFRLKTRSKVAVLIERTFDEDTAGLLGAFLLGDHSGFNQYDLYKEMGLAHIFAISGLHFGIIYHILNKVIPMPDKRLKSIFLILFMAIFLYWIGESYSAQRAFWIILYSEYGKSRGKLSDPLTAIAFSSSMVLIKSPWAILSLSFQLSFYAYTIIVIYLKYWVFKSKLRTPKIIKALEFSILVQVLLLPITLRSFLHFNLFGFVANFLIVPVVGFIMPLGLLTVFLNLFGISFPLNHILNASTNFMSQITKLIPIHTYSIPGFDYKLFDLVLILITFSVVQKCFYVSKKLRKLNMIFLGFSLIIFLLLSNTFSQFPKLHFVDVGHGDFAFFQYGDRAVVIDAGDTYQNTAQHLSQNGIVHIDVLILSHGHMDHIGGVENILSYYTPEVIIGNKATLDQIDNKSMNFYIADNPLNFDWQGIIFQIQPVTSGSNENDNALVAKFEFNSINGYFLGDVSKDILENMAFESKIDFLKVPHHGSKTSIIKSLYANSNIRYAVVSHNYKYGLPHQSVVDLLEMYVYKNFSTYQFGGITFSLKPGEITYKTFLSDIE